MPSRMSPSHRAILFLPELSDSVDSHRGPLGSAVRRGRRNFFPGPRNGSRAAQIVPESPGRDRPTTQTAAAACEGLIETPGALAQPGCFLRRPLRTADPSGPFRKNQNKYRSTQVLVASNSISRLTTETGTRCEGGRVRSLLPPGIVRKCEPPRLARHGIGLPRGTLHKTLLTEMMNVLYLRRHPKTVSLREPQQRSLTPPLAAGLASEYQNRLKVLTVEDSLQLAAGFFN
jgi:hypothetical protein